MNTPNLTTVRQANNQYTLIIGGMCKGKLLDWNKALLGTEEKVYESTASNWDYELSIVNLTATELKRLQGYDYTKYPIDIPALRTVPTTKFTVGDTVTTTTRVEALYSGYHHNPVQYFEPGMKGVVVAVNSPSVRRNVLQYVVEFEGELYGSPQHPYRHWKVRLDKEYIKSV